MITLNQAGTLAVFLRGANLAPLPLNHVFSVGDLKVIRPDNTIANASSLPIATPNSILPGCFDIPYTQAEVNQLGRQRWQLLGNGLDPDGFDYSDTVAAAPSIVVTANVAKGNAVQSQVSYTLNVGDLVPDMALTISQGGVAVDLTTATAINLLWKRPNGSIATVPLTAVNLAQGLVKRVWSSGDTTQVGTHYGKVVVTWPTARPQTFPQDNTELSWVIVPDLA